MFRRLFGPALAAGLLLCAGASAARPVTVEDLLAQGSFGRVAVDPAGRWLVFEQRDPYLSAERFDLDAWMSPSLSRVRIVDLASGAAAAAAPLGDPRGLVLGAFSPSGRRAAVYQLRGREFRLGILTLSSREIRWLDLTPEADAKALAWRSDAELLVLTRPDREPPSGVRSATVRAARLPDAWTKAASGEGGHTVLGSGGYLQVRRRAPPRRLMAVDAATGRWASMLEGEFFRLELSPDGNRAALFGSGPDLSLQADRPARGAAGNETEATRLTLLELESGRVLRPCHDCDLLPSLLAWSADSRGLLTLMRGPDGLWTSGRLLRIDSREGGVAPVCRDVAPDVRVNPAVAPVRWLGSDPLVFGRPVGAADARSDWRLCGRRGSRNLTGALPPPSRELAEAGPGALLAWSGGRLWRLRAAGAVPEPSPPIEGRLSGPLAPVGGPPRPGSDTAVLQSGDTLLRFAADRPGPVDILPAPPGEVLAVSWLQRAAVVREPQPSGAERLVLWQGGARRVLAEVNRHLADADPPEVVAVAHRGLNGEPLTSWLFLPAARGGPPPPLVIRPYLGQVFRSRPVDGPVERGFLQNLRALTGHGYAVLVPSLPARDDGEPALGVADRLLEIVDAASATPGAAGRFDPDRLGLVGFSNGGYSVLSAVSQSSRFRAAAAFAAPTEQATIWANYAEGHVLQPEAGYMTSWSSGLIERTQNSMFAPPWADPARYARNSPFYAADRITTPVLLFHGSEDKLPLSQSTAMFSALFRQGKDAQLVVYWGEDHGLTSPGNVRDYYARLFSFLDGHLAAGVSVTTGRRGPAAARLAPTPRSPSPRGSPPAVRPR